MGKEIKVDKESGGSDCLKNNMKQCVINYELW